MTPSHNSMIGTALTLAIASYAFDSYALAHKIENMAYVRSRIEQDAGLPQTQEPDQKGVEAARGNPEEVDRFGGAFG